MPKGARRAARRPAMPVISVTGRRASNARSASGSRTADAPNGLAVSLMSLASVRVRAMPTVTGTPTVWRMWSRIASAVCLEGQAAVRARPRKRTRQWSSIRRAGENWPDGRRA